MYKLKRIPLNKLNCENEFNIISDTIIKNNLYLKTIKKIKDKLNTPNNMSSDKKVINYSSMKYHKSTETVLTF